MIKYVQRKKLHIIGLPGILSVADCVLCIIVYHLLHSVEFLPPEVGEVLRLIGHEAVEVSGQLLWLGEVLDIYDRVRWGNCCIGFSFMSVQYRTKSLGIQQLMLTLNSTSDTYPNLAKGETLGSDDSG